MSKRTSILKALVEKLKALDGTQYTSNIYNEAFPYLRFWDSVSNFPSIYSSTGTETREYMPGGFAWVFLGISLKIYCKGENANEELEQLLEDIESIIDANRNIVYDTTNNFEVTDILIGSITTDEGLLAPYAVGEINLQMRYAKM